MAQQHLNFGTTAPNDGEFGNTAFPKIQANFDDLYGTRPGAQGLLSVGNEIDTLALSDTSADAREANSAKIAAAASYAINNGIKEICLGPGRASFNQGVGVGVGGADQKSLHLKGSGGGAIENQCTILSFPAGVSTVAINIGNGQMMEASDLAIEGDTSATSRKAMTGVGLGLNHGSHQISLRRVRVSGFNTCYKSGYDGGTSVLCDSVTLDKCSAIGYIGWHVAGTQNYINTLRDPAFSCTVGVKSDVAKPVNVEGGNLSLSSALRKAFTISAVSGLTVVTDSTQLPGEPFTNVTFTAEVASADQPLAAGAYDAFAINTTAFGPIPLRLVDWDGDTDTITLTLDAWWLLTAAFEIDFGGDFGTLIANAISGASTLYACETITVFQGLNANINGVHIENNGSLTCLFDMVSGFGGDDAALINRPTFNYQLDHLSYHGGAADDEAVFMCQQAFGFIRLRGYGANDKAVLKLSGFGTANSTNRVLIDGLGGGKHRLVVEGSDLKPNLRTRHNSAGSTAVTQAEVIHRGFGEWDDSPFAPDADPIWYYSRRKINGVPFEGYFPAEHATPTLRGVELADIDDGLGAIGTYPPLVGRRPLRVNNYDAFDASSSPATARWVESNHQGWSYGQDITTSWSYVAGTNIVRMNDTSRMFAGLCIHFTEDGLSASDKYIVTGVYPTLGYVTVVRNRTGTGLGNLAGTAGTTYSGSTVKQEPFSFSRLGLVPD